MHPAIPHSAESSSNLTPSIARATCTPTRPLSPLPAANHKPHLVSQVVNFALCFHAITNCLFLNSFLFITICVAPSCFPPPAQRSTVNPFISSQILYFQPITNSSYFSKMAIPLPSNKYELFCKNTPGWIPPQQSHPTQDASISVSNWRTR